MEDIYQNVKYDKPIQESEISQNESDSTRFHEYVVLGLVLLSLSVLAGLIGLGVHYHYSVHSADAELSATKASVTEHLQDSDNKLSSLNEERDLPKANPTEMTTEDHYSVHSADAELSATKASVTEHLQDSDNILSSLNEEQDLPKANPTEMTTEETETCPGGWTMFNSSCYLLSAETGSWTTGREDCKKNGADLVVIDSGEEQTFLSGLNAETWSWIGLTDGEVENTWKWIDGTPLNLSYWETYQPDNGGGDPYWGEEDCAHIRYDEEENWNDISCDASLYWICEKKF